MSWPREEIGTLADIFAGSGFPKEHQGQATGDHAFAKVGDISRAKALNGDHIGTAENYVSSAVLKRLRAKLFPEGSIVFAKIGEAIRKNNRAITTCEMAFDNNVMGLRFDPYKVDSRYAYHYLETIDFAELSNSTTVPSIRKTDMAGLKIPLPPLDEQKRVARILDQAAELCRLRSRALEKLNTLGQAIFHEMFGDWQIDAKNWPIVALGDELEFLTSGSRGWAKYYSDSGAKFIRIQNVRRDYFDKYDMAFVRAPESAEAKRTKVRPGDVLLSITADLGRTAVVPEDIGDAHINQHLAILRLRSMNPQYVSAALSSPAGQRVIQKKNREGVKAGLNFDDIRGIELPKPPMDFQEEYVARMRELLASQSKAEDAQRHSEALFASLQHRAFRGEL